MVVDPITAGLALARCRVPSAGQANLRAMVMLPSSLDDVSADSGSSRTLRSGARGQMGDPSIGTAPMPAQHAAASPSMAALAANADVPHATPPCSP